MAKDTEIKKPMETEPIEEPKMVERAVEKTAPLPIKKPKKVVGYKVTERDGKVVKSEPIYS